MGAAVLVLCACACLLVGCGGSGGSARGASHRSTSREARDVAVVEGWSNALRRGDVRAAARYFALPSVFINGIALKIQTARQAQLANQTLSCGARYVSSRLHGRYLEAAFVLTGRSGPGGTSCQPGAGEPAGVAFLISKGKIDAWLRLASAPGPGTPSPGGPTTPSPTTPTTPSPGGPNAPTTVPQSPTI